jgi:hypothetical protein
VFSTHNVVVPPDGPQTETILAKLASQRQLMLLVAPDVEGRDQQALSASPELAPSLYVCSGHGELTSGGGGGQTGTSDPGAAQVYEFPLQSWRRGSLASLAKLGAVLQTEGVQRVRAAADVPA